MLYLVALAFFLYLLTEVCFVTNIFISFLFFIYLFIYLFLAVNVSHRTAISAMVKKNDGCQIIEGDSKGQRAREEKKKGEKEYQRISENIR